MRKENVQEAGMKEIKGIKEIKTGEAGAGEVHKSAAPGKGRTPLEVLKYYFGYDSFREGQQALIDSILSGRDTFGIMPTGAGKSLCYQIPALVMDGIAIVISPLISLMKDQVSALNQAGIHAAYLNSSLSQNQYFKALSYAAQGRYSIIYVAPERLLTDSFLSFALNADISMVAVDEAHCVSQWGQDFRPGYLKIAEFISRLPKRPVVAAFTATATDEVKADVIDLLLLQDPFVAATGFDRPNLWFSVEKAQDKFAAVKDYVKTHSKDSGIIYCLTRKQVEEVCQKLEWEGVPATRYHAGLSDEERRQNQEDFIYDRKPVMVATNAFGMGIDKSNVRYVLHYNMPKNMESYYQEAGRAGRDGEPAECILYYGGQDVITNQMFIERGGENEELDEITRGIVRERDFERLRKMTFYCFTNECLRGYMLRYFGEYGENYCGNCKNCMTKFETVDITNRAGGILGCVDACRQRYGINVILDTVHGGNTAKVRQYRMEENPFFGTCRDMAAWRLRDIFNFLLLKGYLKLTDDSYMIVKLTEKGRIFLDQWKNERRGEWDGREAGIENRDGCLRLVMKLAREEPERGSSGKEGRGRKRAGERQKEKVISAGLKKEDEALFERLRGLRMEIARQEKVPPYIVFSDKTLVAMCAVKPKTKEEMMTVSGVGAFKFEKYGEQFLRVFE